MKLVFDIGNSRIKAGLFLQNELCKDWSGPKEEIRKGIFDFLHQEKVKLLEVAWMSVAANTHPHLWDEWNEFKFKPEFLHVHNGMDLPLKNAYSTPHTLGIDRIVAVVAAYFQSNLIGSYNKKPVLVIDAGTALTYDFATADGKYLGGGISPGMNMRFKALHDFTAKLPLIAPNGFPALVGDSTEKSIQSGVMRGLLSEIDGTIQAYKLKFGYDLDIYLTGGDRISFENHLKSVTFVDSYLTLKGLNRILDESR